VEKCVDANTIESDHEFLIVDEGLRRKLRAEFEELASARWIGCHIPFDELDCVLR
jgi:hypothetical protein